MEMWGKVWRREKREQQVVDKRAEQKDKERDFLKKWREGDR